MPEEYQKITKILVWIVAASMIAYFVITPFTYYRPTPPQVSPGFEQVAPTTTVNIPEAQPLNLSPEEQAEALEDLLPAGPEIEDNPFQPPAGQAPGLLEQQPLPTVPQPGQE